MVVCHIVPHSKYYFYMRQIKQKKWENFSRSIIVNSVLFPNVCDVISVRHFPFYHIGLFFFSFFILSKKGNVFAADF